ncbi:replication-relaxation family protein [Aeromicrobium sp.]|uniref:replication-relaxation family protein n=1 Tax=Aeromicrobium sp. TaxID=1871063 RepID=UPI0035155189
MTRGAVSTRLSERDWEILATVRAFRFLTTRQLSRQHFGLTEPDAVIPRTANSALARLRALGLLVNLDRRIGGVRAGSGGHVWQLTDLGNRLLAEHLGEATGARVRPSEPSTTFLDHTLAIAELVITLQDSTRSGVTIERLQAEPECWRTHLGSAGEPRTLKPDLASVSQCGEFTDFYFWEVDRSTEAPNRVVKKCLQYQQYRDTGAEQRLHGLFPAVVWVVPHPRRREQLERHLAAETRFDQRLFTVIELGQVTDLVRYGADHYKQQQGGLKGGEPS